MYRIAAATDIKWLVDLWQRVFKDTPEFIKRCINVFAGLDNVFVQADKAMLLAVPCEINSACGYYLYALATEPDARKAGVMSGLIEYAEQILLQRGARFTVLIPASEPLFAYYMKRGYATPLFVREIELSAQQWGKASAMCRGKQDVVQSQLDSSVLSYLRKEYLRGPVVNFHGSQLDIIVQDLVESGAKLAVTPAAYAVYSTQIKPLSVLELGAKHEEDAVSLVKVLYETYASDGVNISLGVNTMWFGELGIKKTVALLKKFDPALDVEYAYIRFALDF